MSAFGYTPKDDVVEAIETLAKAEHDRGKTPREIVESVLEAPAHRPYFLLQVGWLA